MGHWSLGCESGKVALETTQGHKTLILRPLIDKYLPHQDLGYYGYGAHTIFCTLSAQQRIQAQGRGQRVGRYPFHESPWRPSCACPFEYHWRAIGRSSDNDFMTHVNGLLTICLLFSMNVDFDSCNSPLTTALQSSQLWRASPYGLHRVQ